MMLVKNGKIEFRVSEKRRSVNEFPSKSDVAAVSEFIRLAKAPGTLEISYPGNGGITSIVFREKERDVTVETLDQNGT